MHGTHSMLVPFQYTLTYSLGIFSACTLISYNIQLAEMKDKIMQLVSLIFHSDRHQHHVALKVRAKKHAFWLKAQNMLPEGSTRYGSDTQRDFFIFDMETFETWLTFLLGNMYVGFGGDLFIQAIGTPMGTKCASNLADFFLASVSCNL